MDPVGRKSLVDETEVALLAALQSGQWSGTLPGVRLLSKTLKVSPPTVQAATARLLKRGVLISQGPRRRLAISSEFHKSATQALSATEKPRRVLFLSDEPLNLMSHRSLEILSLLWMENQHWDIRHHVLQFREAKLPRRQWDRLLETVAPDNLVVFDCNPAIAQWAVNHKLQTVIVGGTAGEHHIPTIGNTPVPIMQEAIRELARRGHSRICMPIQGIFPKLLERLQEGYAEEMERQGLPFDESWNTPSSTTRSADVTWNLMTRVFSVQAPTAIIAMSWVEFVTIDSFLRERRLTIPGDISVILLMESGAVGWFRPALSFFRHSVSRVSRTVQRWVEEGAPSDDIVIRLPGHLVHGKSVRDEPPNREIGRADKS